MYTSLPVIYYNSDPVESERAPVSPQEYGILARQEILKYKAIKSVCSSIMYYYIQDINPMSRKRTRLDKTAIPPSDTVSSEKVQE